MGFGRKDNIRNLDLHYVLGLLVHISDGDLSRPTGREFLCFNNDMHRDRFMNVIVHTLVTENCCVSSSNIFL